MNCRVSEKNRERRTVMSRIQPMDSSFNYLVLDHDTGTGESTYPAEEKKEKEKTF